MWFISGFNDLPRISHRPSLGYTEAVLHESMRLSSVVPTGVAHYTMCDSSICKFYSESLDFSLTVKAATLIFISGCGSAISFAK